jgi:hypothetical protein
MEIQQGHLHLPREGKPMMRVKWASNWNEKFVIIVEKVDQNNRYKRTSLWNIQELEKKNCMESIQCFNFLFLPFQND